MSTITKSDCILLKSYINAAQERLFNYVMNGLKENGPNDDFHLRISLSVLQEYIQKIRDRSPQ